MKKATPTKAAKKATSKKVAAKESKSGPVTMNVKISVEVSEGTPVYYANYLEIAHSSIEFALNVVRIPTKPTRSQMELVQSGEPLTVEPEMQILFSPKLAIGLVKALQLQITAYEAANSPIDKE